MNSLYFSGQYDKDENTVFLKFVNNSTDKYSKSLVDKSSLDILRESSKSAGTKVWMIVDATATSFLTIKTITDISKFVKKILDDTVEDWVAVVSTAAQRVRLKILFTLIRRKQMIVPSTSEAKEVIRNLQLEKGVFPTLE